MVKQTELLKEDVAQRAHELYVLRGMEPGKDLEDWLTAEKELNANTAEKNEPLSIGSKR